MSLGFNIPIVRQAYPNYLHHVDLCSCLLLFFYFVLSKQIRLFVCIKHRQNICTCFAQRNQTLHRNSP